MFSNYLKTIEGIGVYPLFSLLVFFIFFVVIIVWLFKVDKKYIEKMSNLPLDLKNTKLQSQNINGKNYIEDNNEIQ